jgi:hypothetical protein
MANHPGQIGEHEIGLNRQIRKLWKQIGIGQLRSPVRLH